MDFGGHNSEVKLKLKEIKTVVRISELENDHSRNHSMI